MLSPWLAGRRHSSRDDDRGMPVGIQIVGRAVPLLAWLGNDLGVQTTECFTITASTGTSTAKPQRGRRSMVQKCPFAAWAGRAEARERRKQRPAAHAFGHWTIKFVAFIMFDGSKSSPLQTVPSGFRLSWISPLPLGRRLLLNFDQRAQEILRMDKRLLPVDVEGGIAVVRTPCHAAPSSLRQDRYPNTDDTSHQSGASQKTADGQIGRQRLH
jgi:hypothetical protein